MKSNSNKAEFLKFNTPGVCWGNGPKLPFFNPRPSTSLEEGGAVGSATQRDSPFVKKLDLYKSLNTWTRDIVFWVVGAVPPQKSPSCLLPAGVFFFSRWPSFMLGLPKNFYFHRSSLGIVDFPGVMGAADTLACTSKQTLQGHCSKLHLRGVSLPANATFSLIPHLIRPYCR